jgi:hypothetical protein
MYRTRVLARRRSARFALALTATVALGASAPAAAPAAAKKPPKPKPFVAPPRPYSFLLNYTDQLGVPGFPGGTAVTPQSDLYTGFAELSLRVGAGGRSFPSDGRTLADDRYPVLTSIRLDHNILYTLTVFAAPVGGQQVNFARVDAFNPDSKRVRPARVSAFIRNAGVPLITHPNGRTYRAYRFGRPALPARLGLYSQPGAEFNPSSQFAFSGATFLRDGAVMYDSHPVEPGATLAQSVRVDAVPVDRQTIFGQTGYDAMVKPRKQVHVDLRMPVTPMAPATPQYGAIRHASFNAYLRKTIDSWRQLQRRAMRVDLPEPRVVNTFYSSLNDILLPRYRLGANGDWVQAVNQQRYHAFWLRDAAVMNHALDVVGLHRQARQNLPFFLTWQDPNGLFISRPGQLDGFGQALWALGDHYLRTNDGALARRSYPAVQRAMAWFELARAADPLRLIPVGDPGDDENVQGHLTGDDFWAYAGIEQAAEMARRLGHAADAKRWRRVLADFRGTLQAVVRGTAPRLGGFIPPALEGGGQDWGNYWAAYPARVFAPDDPLVTATIRHARSEFREGVATYGEPKMLHPFLGLRILETQLERNEQREVIDGFYGALAHTTSTGAWFDTSILPFGDRTSDLATVPHGWAAAEYVTLLRNMLVREDGNAVVLMSALSPSWLKPGQVVAVRDVPTTFGTVAFSLRTTPTGATLTWRSSLKSGIALSWPVPDGVRNVHAPGLSRGVIHLRGRRGALHVLWKIARGPEPTLKKTVAALLKQYRANGGGAGAARNVSPAVTSDRR